MVNPSNYGINCLMTNIVDLNSITCEIEPDSTKFRRFQSAICALGFVPYVLPVWQIGIDAYELYPTKTNAAMFKAIRELLVAGLSPAQVTVCIAPSKKYAATLAGFVAEFDDD